MDAHREMAEPAETFTSSVAANTPDSLTFAWLYQQVQSQLSKRNGPRSTKLERVALWFGLGTMALGLGTGLVTRWASPGLLVYIAQICLMAEIAGLGLFLLLMLRRELPQFLRPRAIHADEMDAEFAKWQELCSDLRRFSAAERQSRLRFVALLRAGMGERMGLVYGGFQRLGVFPVLAALYLQFRSWKWGDWAGAFDMNALAGLLIWSMVLLYVCGWLLIGIRTRLDTYVNLLENSLREIAVDDRKIA